MSWSAGWAQQNNAIPASDITAAIVWMPPPEFFAGLRNLQTVYAVAAGVDQLLSHPGLPAQTTVVRLRDAGMAQQMAEYVLYGVLHAQRQMAILQRAQASCQWAHSVSVRPAAQFQVGILGAGALGRRVATQVAGNGYPVTCWSRSERPSTELVRHVNGPDALEGFLNVSDVLVCLLPLTEATEGMLNADLFRQLPTGAFLINPGRGAHLVEADLLQALGSGRLAGALLDVFQEEPLPQSHPFWTNPAIIVTPHVAAKSLERESVDQIVESIQRVERGVRPAGVVDRQRGY